MNFFADYLDIVSVALIPMIIAIFALGFQTISRIDDKYNSTKLIEAFREDWRCNFFLISLLSAVASYVIWIFQFPPIVNWDWLEDSAIVLLLVSTVFLIIATIILVPHIYTYYVPKMLFKHLKRLHNKATKKEEKRLFYFEVISKILNYSINKSDEPLARTLNDFYNKVFIELKENRESKVIDYPQEYYDVFFEANELLCNRNRKTISCLDDGKIFAWFLTQSKKTLKEQKIIISPNTREFFWKLILQCVSHNKENLILSYNEQAHLFFELFLQENHLEYEPEKEEERENFRKFHNALCGLLMYNKKYKIIREIMSYSQKEYVSYAYVFVPNKMQVIIDLYMEKNIWKFNVYSFLNNYSDADVNEWVKRYLSILFIKQCSIEKHPSTLYYPEELYELEHWKKGLSELKRFVLHYLSQKDILEKLGLDELGNPEWFNENKKENPTVFIDRLIKQVDAQHREAKNNVEISDDKENEFIEETKKHLKPVFEKYNNLFRGEQTENNTKSFYINGTSTLFEKTNFENAVNSASVTASDVGDYFRHKALNTFALMSLNTYILRYEEMLDAIEELKIDAENFVIISTLPHLNYL